MRRFIVIAILAIMATLFSPLLRSQNFSAMPDTTGVTAAVPDSLSAASPKPEAPKRTVTPVDIDDKAPVTVLHYYDKHGNALKEPVRFLATLDTVTKPKSKPIYPVYNGVSVGANFGDALFMACGQKYASFDLWADVSIHNWFFPILEAGVGMSDNTPSDKNFSFRVRPSFYAKLGMNYNFIYKSNPDYQVFAGLRAGYSHFTWDVKDVSISSDYWGEDQRFNMAEQHTTALWGELLAGIKVKIVSRFSLGWTARWHFKFMEKNSGVSGPSFIPGYGGSSPFTFTLSAIWSFGPSAKPKAGIADSGTGNE